MYLDTSKSLAAFNSGKSSGEAFRTSMIEPLYSVPFVRSNPPTFVTKRSIWSHPDENISKTRPIGLVTNAIWQQNYISRTPAVNYQVRNFNSHVELMAAFQNEEIGQFLCVDVIMDAFAKKEIYKIKAIKQRTIASISAYHYLHEDYSEFMTDFSNYLKQHNPFNSPE